MAVALALLGVMLTGCGGTDQPSADATKPASSTPARSLTPVETASCRSTVEPLLDVFEVMRTEASGGGMDAGALQARFDKLHGAEDSVRSVCTDAVYTPYAEAVYELALVNAMIQTCDTAAACDKAGLPKHMQRAMDQQGPIRGALDAKR